MGSNPTSDTMFTQGGHGWRFEMTRNLEPVSVKVLENHTYACSEFRGAGIHSL